MHAPGEEQQRWNSELIPMIPKGKDRVWMESQRSDRTIMTVVSNKD